MKKKKSRIPKSPWGYRGVPGKGGKPLNAVIISKEPKKEEESE
jgi:hypothetical protein